MGYDFLGSHRKTDEKSIFWTHCMYAYEPVFKQCFGKEISLFSGRITKDKIKDFKKGLDIFKSNPNNNRDCAQFPNDISNITYTQLCEDLSKLLELMENKEVCYLSIW